MINLRLLIVQLYRIGTDYTRSFTNLKYRMSSKFRKIIMLAQFRVFFLRLIYTFFRNAEGI